MKIKKQSLSTVFRLYFSIGGKKCEEKKNWWPMKKYATLALKFLIKKDCEILLSIWSDGMTNCNFWLIAVKDLQNSKYDQSVMLRSDIEWKRKGCGLCWFYIISLSIKRLEFICKALLFSWPYC